MRIDGTVLPHIVHNSLAVQIIGQGDRLFLQSGHFGSIPENKAFIPVQNGDLVSQGTVTVFCFLLKGKLLFLLRFRFILPEALDPLVSRSHNLSQRPLILKDKHLLSELQRIGL